MHRAKGDRFVRANDFLCDNGDHPSYVVPDKDVPVSSLDHRLEPRDFFLHLHQFAALETAQTGDQPTTL